MTAPARVLVVDDEADLREVLSDALGSWGYEVTVASTGAEAVQLVSTQLFDAALLDVNLGPDNGVQVLRELRANDDALDVVMMTGYPTVATAVATLRDGATDYLSKPLNLDELRHIIGRVIERRLLRREVSTLRRELGEQLTTRELLGASPAMQRVKETLSRVAPNDTSVLIEGESGTGKELAAAAIHRDSSRSKGPFIPVNCAAVPANLLESEFFGHLRGAFTGAVADSAGLFRSADNGTMFLDEVGDLPIELQAKLLRVLQDREVRPVGSSKTVAVDVRLIAATNRPLDEDVRQGRFRQDLFYRLNVVRIQLPPLRARKADLPILVHHFLKRFNARYGREVQGVAPEVLAALRAYDFPGNVRELENVIERAYALGATRTIGPEDLPPLTGGAGGVRLDEPVPTLVEMERDLITRALQKHAGDRSKAAKALGISDRTIYRKLKEYRPG
ncbi:MAG TPA: sigma-54 dependent transcriptional regulator [Methylomirabilota bacterium]|nr:sigma-54 dependent transcriptional regulator [Methylomirabilota bacterium]